MSDQDRINEITGTLHIGATLHGNNIAARRLMVVIAVPEMLPMSISNAVDRAIFSEELGSAAKKQFLESMAAFADSFLQTCLDEQSKRGTSHSE